MTRQNLTDVYTVSRFGARRHGALSRPKFGMKLSARARARGRFIEISSGNVTRDTRVARDPRPYRTCSQFDRRRTRETFHARLTPPSSSHVRTRVRHASARTDTRTRESLVRSQLSPNEIRRAAAAAAATRATCTRGGSPTLSRLTTLTGVNGPARRWPRHVLRIVKADPPARRADRETSFEDASDNYRTRGSNRIVSGLRSSSPLLSAHDRDTCAILDRRFAIESILLRSFPRLKSPTPVSNRRAFSGIVDPSSRNSAVRLNICEVVCYLFVFNKRR